MTITIPETIAHGGFGDYTGAPPVIFLGDARQITPHLPNGIRAIVTDPPYGIGYQSNKAVTAEGARWAKEIAGDLTIDEAIDLFYAVMEPLIPKTLEDAELYCFCDWEYVEVFKWCINSFANFEVKSMLVWDKMDHGQGDLLGDWAPTWEGILYAKKGKWKHPSRKDNVLHFAKLRPNEMFHPTQKPVGLLERIITQSSNRGDLIVDPFAGSGSTIKAAQNIGRRAIGIELNVDHHKRAVESLNEVTIESMLQGG